MIRETNSEKETYELGFQMGTEARPGDVYTLVGDLGVGKTVFTQGLAAGLEVGNQSTVLHLRSCRYMRKGVCPSIILTFTGSEMQKRWKKSGMKTISTGRASA